MGKVLLSLLFATGYPHALLLSEQINNVLCTDFLQQASRRDNQDEITHALEPQGNDKVLFLCVSERLC